MTIFLYISIIPLVLSAAMAWLFNDFRGNPEQRAVSFILWAFIGFAAFLSLVAGGLTSLWSFLTVAGTSAVGYFFDDFLGFLFPDPGFKAPRD